MRIPRQHPQPQPQPPPIYVENAQDFNEDVEINAVLKNINVLYHNAHSHLVFNKGHPNVNIHNVKENPWW